MLEVLLTGTYSARNKGDAAMQIGCALELQRQLGPVRVTIACPFPEMDRAVYEPYGIAVVPSHRRKLGRCLPQMSLGRGGLQVARWIGSPDAAAIRRSAGSSIGPVSAIVGRSTDVNIPVATVSALAARHDVFFNFRVVINRDVCGRNIDTAAEG